MVSSLVQRFSPLVKVRDSDGIGAVGGHTSGGVDIKDCALRRPGAGGVDTGPVPLCKGWKESAQAKWIWLSA